MKLRRIQAVSLRYMLLLKDNPTRMFQIFIWSFLDVLLWGFITKYLDSVGTAGFSFVPALLGAVILMSFFTRSQQGISTPFMEDIWSRNLLNFFASPLTIAEYLAGFVAISIFTSIIGVVFMALCAWIGFGFSVLTYGLSLFLLLITLFICGISLGIIAIAILLRFGPSAEWFIWPIPAVLSPFVGVYYPIAVLPGWMQFIGRLVPLSYVFEGARGLILHDGASVLFLIVGTALSFVYLGISCVVFGRVYRRVVREGTLARMGTE